MKLIASPQSLRLDRFVSHSATLSRSQVKRLLHADQIDIDGVIERDPGVMVSEDNKVSLQGKILCWPRPHYVMLNKPAGYVCSTEDAGYPVVSSLIEQPWGAALHSAGRLDVDTTGLVLLTSDGDWSHALTSPRRSCLKTYLVGLKHPLSVDISQRFAEGLMLNGETKLTLPAQLVVLGTHTARVSVQEGRYHQVKRMFAACSNRVLTLHRESIGNITLDPELLPGAWRELTPTEVEN